MVADKKGNYLECSDTGQSGTDRLILLVSLRGGLLDLMLIDFFRCLAQTGIKVQKSQKSVNKGKQA